MFCSVVGSSRCNVLWLCWGNNLLFKHLVDFITASSNLVYLLLLDPTHRHLSALISISRFFSFFVVHGGLPHFLFGSMKDLSSDMSL